MFASAGQIRVRMACMADIGEGCLPCGRQNIGVRLRGPCRKAEVRTRITLGRGALQELFEETRHSGLPEAAGASGRTEQMKL